MAKIAVRKFQQQKLHDAKPLSQQSVSVGLSLFIDTVYASADSWISDCDRWAALRSSSECSCALVRRDRPSAAASLGASAHAPSGRK